MPLTLKTGAVKVKDLETDEYVDIDLSIGDDFVPNTRTVNDKELSTDITLNASDIPNDSDVTGTNVDDALETLDDKIDALGSDDIANDSENVSGATVTDAIDNLKDAINAIGQHVQGTSVSVTVPTATVTELTSVLLPQGNWLIIGSFAFTSGFNEDANGYLILGATVLQTTRGTGKNGGTFAPLVGYVSGTNNTTVSMKTYQASGSDKTAGKILLNAIRIS